MAREEREAGAVLPNNQRQHRTSHVPKDVLPSRICADYCAPCQDSRIKLRNLFSRRRDPLPSEEGIHIDT